MLVKNWLVYLILNNPCRFRKKWDSMQSFIQASCEYIWGWDSRHNMENSL